MNLNHEGRFSNVLQAQDREKYWRSWQAMAETNPQAASRVAKYSRRPAVEFYDVRSDPYELKNLALVPQHAERIAAMRRALDTWMKSQGDEGMKTELAARSRQKPSRKPKRR